MAKVAYLLLALVTVSILAAPFALDELLWQQALNKNTSESYAEYLNREDLRLHALHAERAKERLSALEEQKSWEESLNKNSLAAYRDYVSAYPAGKYSAFAQARIAVLSDGPDWEKATRAGTLAAFGDYVRAHPKGEYLKQATTRIAELNETQAWEQAQNTILAVHKYLKEFPNSRYRSAAEQHIERLKNDSSVYAAIQDNFDLVTLERFLAEYPGHKNEGSVRARIAEIKRGRKGRSIVDLIAEGKIEARTRGAGIRKVHVSLRKLVDYPISVDIPVGTFFVSARRSAQNMVATSQRTVSISNDSWLSIDLPAACANRPRDIPGTSDSFKIQRSPNQTELEKVMPIVRRRSSNFGVLQAAVWIITDDASFGDLGILVQRSSYQAFGGTRVIKEKEAGSAMRILAEAGVLLQQKRIWKDRMKILSGLPDGDLKTWLQTIAPKPN